MRVRAAIMASARGRSRRRKLSQVEALVEMDAEELSFPDDSFDSVIALYVASVVPNPAKFAAEMRRVCIPGGTIVIVNHFTSENPAMRFIEKRLAPLAGKIGFHADFPLNQFLAASRFDVREMRPSNLFGYCRLLGCVDNN